jgi:GNAT superfamily N-acetyltransferase
MEFEIKLAQTEEERQEVYRFRYQIYIEEMGRNVHANHDRKILTDWMDENAHLFYVPYEGQVIGTARVNFKRDGPIELEEEYDLQRFNRYNDFIATTSKFMIDPKHRKWKLTPLFLKFIYEFDRQNGIRIDFINTNPPLDDFYAHIGYRRYKSSFEHSEYGIVVPMIMLGEDVEHLKSVRSPLYRSALRFKNNKDGLLELLNREPVLG